MKGTIIVCMEELVTAKFGREKWKEALRKAYLPEGKRFSFHEDVKDSDVLALIRGIAAVVGITVEKAMAAFGEFWSTVFAPRVYQPYFRAAHSTREFLLRLDDVHVEMTKSMKDAKPPRFTYLQKGEKDLVMRYQSSRGLVALMPGLIAGLGRYYHDHPEVRLSGNEIHVHFQ